MDEMDKRKIRERKSIIGRMDSPENQAASGRLIDRIEAIRRKVTQKDSKADERSN